MTRRRLNRLNWLNRFFVRLTQWWRRAWSTLVQNRSRQNAERNFEAPKKFSTNSDLQVKAHSSGTLQQENVQASQVSEGDSNVVLGINYGAIIITQNTEERYRRKGLPFLAPPLPSYFVDRPEPRNEVKAHLLSEDTEISGTLVVSAIHGLGGIGKSTLAAALAHEREVQEHFPDGILWATLGQQPDLLSFLSSWIQVLGDYDYKPTTPEAASVHLRTLLYDKRALLVVDDVWDSDHVKFFQCAGSRCRVLITTREARILGATQYDLDVMSLEQAMSLLIKAQPQEMTQIERQQAQSVAEEVGCLPLALELVAAQITDGTVTWEELLRHLQAEIARLEKLDLREVERIGSEEKRKDKSLIASLNLSLMRLSAYEIPKFAWLGILPEDALINKEMASTLWSVSVEEAGKILRSFQARALLLKGSSQILQAPLYRLHDLMHDMARRLLTEDTTSSQSSSVLSLGISLHNAHAILVERYRSKTKTGLWHTLPNDGYIHAYLSWHLEKAGLDEQIHQLLAEETQEGRNAWYQACAKSGETASYLKDVARAWSLAEKEFTNCPHTSIALQYRYALITASLRTLAKNISAQLVVELVNKQVWTPIQALAYRQQIQNLEQRAWISVGLVPYFPESVAEALDSIQDLQQDKQIAEALGYLALYLPKILLPKALEIAATLKDEQLYFNTLNVLLIQVPKALLPQALEAARKIQSNLKRSGILCLLASQFPEILQEALDEIKKIRTPGIGFDILVPLFSKYHEVHTTALESIYETSDVAVKANRIRRLVPHLSNALIPKVLEITRRIKSAEIKAKVLDSLIPHLPSHLLPQTLKIVKEIHESSLQMPVLLKLAPNLSESHLSDVLNIAQAEQVELSKARFLVLLFPHLTQSLMSRALKLILQIRNDKTRSQALVKIIPNLPSSLLSETSKAIREIRIDSDRIIVRFAFALHKIELKSAVIEEIQAIQNEKFQFTCIKELTPLYPTDLAPIALQVIQRIHDEKIKISSLCELVPYLPEVSFTEALRIIQSLQNESYQVYTLSKIAPYIPRTNIPAALKISQAFQEEADQALVLIKLIPYLTEALLPEALNTIRRFTDSQILEKVITELKSHLSESIVRSSQKTQKIQDEIELIQKDLNRKALSKQLEELQTIQDTSYQARTLVLLVRFRPELGSRALEAVRKIEDSENRADLLSLLVPYVSETLSEALETMQQIQSAMIRKERLEEFIKNLPSTLIPPAFELIKKFQMHIFLQVESLEDLEQRYQSLQASTNVQIISLKELTKEKEESLRFEALKKIVPQLAEDQLSETLEIVEQFWDVRRRVHILSLLAPQLPSSFLPEALGALRGAWNGLSRNDVLWELLSDFYNIELASMGTDTINWDNLLTLPTSFVFLSNMLHFLAQQNRRDFLLNISDSADLIFSLGGSEAIAQTAQAIQDVGKQWL